MLMCFLDDWRADGYCWRQVGAAKAMRSSSTDLQKFYFQGPDFRKILGKS